jgi:hypothetical protein
VTRVSRVAGRADVKSALRSMRVFLALSALTLACSGIRVDHDYDPSANFASLQTWAWLPHAGRSGDPRLDNALLDSRIRAAVESELAAKGYARASSGKPDFQVTYHLSVEGKLAVDTVYRDYPPGSYGRVGYRRGGWGYTETRVREYDEGTLLIDVLQAESGALLWRGSGVATVREESTPEKRTKRINTAVEKILERFPPNS